MQKNNGYMAYSKTNVQTTDQLSLIIMLYDGAIRFMRKAINKINTNDVEGAHNYLLRSRDIIAELLSTLKVKDDDPVSNNLKNLYVFCYNKLVEANLNKDIQMIEDVIQVVNTLRQAWCDLKAQQNRQQQTMNSIPKRKFSAHG